MLDGRSYCKTGQIMTSSSVQWWGIVPVTSAIAGSPLRFLAST